MAIYYKITNVSSRSTKGERNIFLIEAGKLLKHGESVYNVRRLNPGTKERGAELGLHIEEKSVPWKDLNAPIDDSPEAAPKAKHKVIEAPDGIVSDTPTDESKSEEAPATESDTIESVSTVTFDDAPSESSTLSKKAKRGRKSKKGSSDS